MNASPGFFWYFAPGNLAVNFAIVIALLWCFDIIAKHVSRNFNNINRASQYLESCPLQQSLVKIIYSFFIILSLSEIGFSPIQKIKPYRFAKDYINIAKWISDNTPNNVRVSNSEIGYIGFYSNREIRDPFNIIHPRAIKEKRFFWWTFDDNPPEIMLGRYRPETKTAYPSYPFKYPESLIEEFKKRYRTVYRTGHFHVWQLLDENKS